MRGLCLPFSSLRQWAVGVGGCPASRLLSHFNSWLPVRALSLPYPVVCRPHPHVLHVPERVVVGVCRSGLVVHLPACAVSLVQLDRPFRLGPVTLPSFQVGMVCFTLPRSFCGHPRVDVCRYLSSRLYCCWCSPCCSCRVCVLCSAAHLHSLPQMC